MSSLDFNDSAYISFTNALNTATNTNKNIYQVDDGLFVTADKNKKKKLSKEDISKTAINHLNNLEEQFKNTNSPKIKEQILNNIESLTLALNRFNKTETNSDKVAKFFRRKKLSPIDLAKKYGQNLLLTCITSFSEKSLWRERFAVSNQTLLKSIRIFRQKKKGGIQNNSPEHPTKQIGALATNLLDQVKNLPRGSEKNKPSLIIPGGRAGAAAKNVGRVTEEEPQKELMDESVELTEFDEKCLQEDLIARSRLTIFHAKVLDKSEYSPRTLDFTDEINPFNSIEYDLKCSIEDYEKQGKHDEANQLKAILLELQSANKTITELSAIRSQGGSSPGHAILYKIERESDDTLSFTIINTGEGVSSTDGATVKDVKYTGLRDEDLTTEFIEKLLSYRIGIERADHTNTINQYIDNHFKQQLDARGKQKISRISGETHQMQQKNTCGVQCILAWLEGRMDPQLYKKFELDMTKRAIAEAEVELKKLAVMPFRAKLIFGVERASEISAIGERIIYESGKQVKALSERGKS